MSKKISMIILLLAEIVYLVAGIYSALYYKDFVPSSGYYQSFEEWVYFLWPLFRALIAIALFNLVFLIMKIVGLFTQDLNERRLQFFSFIIFVGVRGIQFVTYFLFIMYGVDFVWHAVVAVLTLAVFIAEWRLNCYTGSKSGKIFSMVVLGGYILSLIISVAIGIYTLTYAAMEEKTKHDTWNEKISQAYEGNYQIDIRSHMDSLAPQVFLNITDEGHTIESEVTFDENNDIVLQSFISPSETPLDVLAIPVLSEQGEAIKEQFKETVVQNENQVVNKYTFGPISYVIKGREVLNDETVNTYLPYDFSNRTLEQLMEESRKKGNTAFDGLADISIEELVKHHVLIPSVTIPVNEMFEEVQFVSTIDASNLVDGLYRITFTGNQYETVAFEVKNGKIEHVQIEEPSQEYQYIDVIRHH